MQNRSCLFEEFSLPKIREYLKPQSVQWPVKESSNLLPRLKYDEALKAQTSLEYCTPILYLYLQFMRHVKVNKVATSVAHATSIPHSPSPLSPLHPPCPTRWRFCYRNPKTISLIEMNFHIRRWQRQQHVEKRNDDWLCVCGCVWVCVGVFGRHFRVPAQNCNDLGQQQQRWDTQDTW